MNISGWYKAPSTRRFYPLAGAVIGVLAHLMFFMFSLLQYGGVEYMGVRDDSVADTVASKFTDTIVLLGLETLALQLAVGLVVGLLVGAWWLLWAGWRERSLTRCGVMWRLFAGIAGVHLFVLWYGMTLYPQAFLEAFYHSNWFLKGVQAVASRWIPLWFYKLLFSGVVLSYVGMGLLWALRVFGGSRKARRHVVAGFGCTAPLVLAVLLIVWGGLPDTWRFGAPRPAGKPNVLLLVSDSLRPDYMVSSGGEGFKPILDGAVQYKEAYSVFPRTFPAWMSMLTGKQPYEHGIRHMFPQPEKLAKPYESLAGILKAEGYETAIFSDFAGDIFSRVDLGFDYVDVPTFSLKSNVRLGVWKMQVHLLPYLILTGIAPSIPELQAYERLPDPSWLSDRFFRWLTEREDEKPYFAVLFYSTTHFPYSAPYPYYREALGDYEGPHQFCKTGLGKEVTEADQAQVRRVFAATVRAIDDEYARVRGFLEEEGSWDSMVVVLTADHGENLYESNRGNGHGDMLDGKESLLVPLAYRVPGVEAQEVSGPVSTIDVAPTLLGFLGVEVPKWMGGVNLAKQPGLAPPEHRSVYSETGLLFVDPDVSLEGRSIRYGDLTASFDYTADTSDIFLQNRVEKDALLAKHHMILKDGFKLIYIPSRQHVSLVCYNVAEDAEETNPLDPHKEPGCKALIEPLYRHMTAAGGQRVGDYVLP